MSFSKPANIASKRKHLSLPVTDKVDLIELENDCSVKSLCAVYGIGLSTVYDIKK